MHILSANIRTHLMFFSIIIEKHININIPVCTDNVEYESFSMETTSRDNVIDHPKYRVTLERGAQLVPGKVGNGVLLRGNGEYVDLGEHMDKCFANINVCKHGLTVSLWLQPKSLRTNQYFLSGPTYSLYLENGKLTAKFISNDKVWTVASQNIHLNEYNNIMLSWEPVNGLQLYIDDLLMDRNREPTDIAQGDQSQTGSLYIGKSSDKSIADTAEMMADEVQFWYANAERLQASGMFKGQCLPCL